MRSDFDDAVIRSYLLGRLPEREAEPLEEAYLAQPEVWERVRGVEDDLLDDYAAGRLGPDEKTVFESRYLASPHLRARVVAARTLRHATARVGPPRAVAARQTRWFGPLAAAAGVLLAIVAFWRAAPRPPQVTSASVAPASAAHSVDALRSDAARPTPSAIAPAARPTPQSVVASVVLALSPVLLRGQSRSAELRVPASTDAVVFELEGDPAVVPPSGRSLAASITTVEGAVVWRGEARRMTDPERPLLVASTRLPAARLPPGDYLLALSLRGADDGILHRYFFRVIR